jgi:hypothetical protein
LGLKVALDVFNRALLLLVAIVSYLSAALVPPLPQVPPDDAKGEPRPSYGGGGIILLFFVFFNVIANTLWKVFRVNEFHI